MYVGSCFLSLRPASLVRETGVRSGPNMTEGHLRHLALYKRANGGVHRVSASTVSRLCSEAIRLPKWFHPDTPSLDPWSCECRTMEEATSTRSSVRACLQCKQKKIRCLSDKESDTCQRWVISDTLHACPSWTDDATRPPSVRDGKLK